MAVVNVLSTPVTNMGSTPIVYNKAHVDRGRLLSNVGVATVTNGDSIGSTYRCVRIRSSDRVDSILLSCPAITTCAGDVGLYDTPANGGAVVDADFFASAQSLASILSNADVTMEAQTNGALASQQEKQVWEALGLTADPQKEYDVTVTLTAAAGSGGFVCIKARYAGGS